MELAASRLKAPPTSASVAAKNRVERSTASTSLTPMRCVPWSRGSRRPGGVSIQAAIGATSAGPASALTASSPSSTTSNPDATPDLSLLDAVPQAHIDLARLPEDRQRALYDAFHLELRYNDLTGQLVIRVTITGETATGLAAAVNAAAGEPTGGHAGPTPDDLCADALRARGGIRTRTLFRAADFKSAVSAIPPPGHGPIAANPTPGSTMAPCNVNRLSYLASIGLVAQALRSCG